MWLHRFGPFVIGEPHTFGLNFQHRKIEFDNESFNRFHTLIRPLWARNIYQSPRKKGKNKLNSDLYYLGFELIEAKKMK